MNSIASFEHDVNCQVNFLKEFVIQKPISKSKQAKKIFCGSGDSLAAAMLAEAHSGLKIKSADPLDLLKNKSILSENDVYIISISGKTISNIKVAKLAKNSIAITSKPNSKLAKVSNCLISLKSPNSDVVTGGSISFLDSALTCISLVSLVKLQNPEKIFKKAIEESKKIRLENKIFYLGNLHTYPIALYAAAKLYELLGSNAYYERLEQFSHMELFSTRPGDTVIIFEQKNKHNSILVKNLKKVGINVIQPSFQSKNLISQFLFYTFFSQLVPLLIAKKNHQKECHFVKTKNLRKASDNMIY